MYVYIALLDRIEEFGREICHHNCLSDPLSVAQPSLVSDLVVVHSVDMPRDSLGTKS